MIYQMIDRASGRITETISAPNDKIAVLYLKDGTQDLYQGGEMLMPRSQLRVENGTLVRDHGEEHDAGIVDSDIPVIGTQLRFVENL